MQYIYLHGFASSPNSTKAQQIKSHLADLGIELQIPDLNQGDFSHLTMTRQIQQVSQLFNHDGVGITLIGSSLGGLTAAHLAQMYTQVKGLILLAPAFGFLSHWLSKLGEEKISDWKGKKYLPVYHYGEKRELPLHIEFLEDAKFYSEEKLQRPVPTLIWHGINDEVIPVTASREYGRSRPWVKLMEVTSDHSLVDVMPEICGDMIKHINLLRNSDLF